MTQVFSDKYAGCSARRFMFRAIDKHLYWITPKGKTVLLESNIFYRDWPQDTTFDAEAHPRGASMAAVSLATKYPQCANWLRSIGMNQRFYHRPIPGYRHNLSRIECQELASHIRDWRKGNTDLTAIADWLNDASAASSIVGSLRQAGITTVCMGACGHFLDIDYCSYHTSDGSGVCDYCVDSGEWRAPEDERHCVYREDSLYQHSNGGYYTYEEEDEGEGEGEGIEGLYTYSTDIVSRRDLTVPNASATGDFPIGVELEVYAAHDGARRGVIRATEEHFGRHALCKTDASLNMDRGLEIVTAPMYPKQALDLFNRFRLPRGTTAWNNGHCGLHVHIDSHAFTPLSIAKFLAFWNDEGNARGIRSVAGRHPDMDPQASEYAARVEATGSTLRKAKNHAHGSSRYRIVNLCNLSVEETERLKLSAINYSDRDRNTVELRVFRASLKRSRLLAQLELAVASVYFARDTSMNAVSWMDFEKWMLRNGAQYPHLAAWLTLRRPLRTAPGEANETLDELAVA